MSVNNENAEQSIYGRNLPAMREVMDDLLSRIDGIRVQMKEDMGADPVEHLLSRIKEEDSMREKCARKGLPPDSDSALTVIHDALGIRVVCLFINDVYTLADKIAALDGVSVFDSKDYIRHAKPNGYRSYHMILSVPYSGTAGSDYGSYYVEIQLRTISMDTWASLEHRLKYKKTVRDQALIVSELKRCADELESTDLSMQTLRDLIYEEG